MSMLKPSSDWELLLALLMSFPRESTLHHGAVLYLSNRSSRAFSLLKAESARLSDLGFIRYSITEKKLDEVSQ